MHKLFFGLFLSVTLLSCNAQQSVSDTSYSIMLKGLLEHNVKEISVAEARKKQSQLVFLDARELKEFQVSHIQHAIWVGYDTFDSKRLAKISKSSPIVVYCSVGYRSEKITQKLKALGYSNVSNLYGGIFEWVNQGNLVVNSNGKSSKTHAYDKSWGVWLRKGEKVY